MAQANREEQQQKLEDGIRPALVDKKFLSSNATSHEWMFGAIAELIDNACDPDVKATQFWIDIATINNETCLTFTDDGNGMNTDALHRMLSFGFSDKTAVNGHIPIGRYGNGFKSGSMRLGRDALVLTTNSDTMSIGMLSQTYLEKINSETVFVPIVTWEINSRKIICPSDGSRKSLNEILKYSLLSKEDDIMREFDCIPVKRRKKKGTRIIIYHLARDEKGGLELDLDSDPEDIRLSTCNDTEENTGGKSVGQYRTSLKRYISILYMRPPMQLFLRTKKVKTICINRFITDQRLYTYSPKGFTVIQPIKIRFGLNPYQDEYGIMMYNRNRLIQAFRKSSFPKKLHDTGEVNYQLVREILETVIGVVQLDCLTPNHIKQNFQDDIKFRNIENNLKSRLWNYCTDIADEKEKLLQTGQASNSKEKDLWVQCCYAECQKWRRLPFGTKEADLPEKWYCRMNPDRTRNKCEDPQEPEDEPEVQKGGKKPRRSASSSTARLNGPTSPVHEAVDEIPCLTPQLQRIALEVQKQISTSVAAQGKSLPNVTATSLLANSAAASTTPRKSLSNVTATSSLLANTATSSTTQGKSLSNVTATSSVANTAIATASHISCADEDSATDSEIEEISFDKPTPEVITINDDDDEGNRPVKQIKLEALFKRSGIRNRNNSVSTLNHREGKFAMKTESSDSRHETLPLSHMSNSLDSMDHMIMAVPEESLQTTVEAATSPIPMMQPSLPPAFARELKKYEQEIAELHWQKSQLQKELESTREDLEQERRRANTLQEMVDQYEVILRTNADFVMDDF